MSASVMGEQWTAEKEQEVRDIVVASDGRDVPVAWLKDAFATLDAERAWAEELEIFLKARQEDIERWVDYADSASREARRDRAKLDTLRAALVNNEEAKKRILSTDLPPQPFT